MSTLKYTGLFTAVLAAASGLAADRPITISRGSPLRVAHAAGWDPDSDNHQFAPKTKGTLTSIDVQQGNAAPQRVDCMGSVCEVTLTYGDIQPLKAFTNPQGKNLKIRSDPKKFLQHFHIKDAATFESNADSIITNLAITKAGQPVIQIAAPASPTVITIHYDDAQ